MGRGGNQVIIMFLLSKRGEITNEQHLTKNFQSLKKLRHQPTFKSAI